MAERPIQRGSGRRRYLSSTGTATGAIVPGPSVSTRSQGEPRNAYLLSSSSAPGSRPVARPTVAPRSSSTPSSSPSSPSCASSPSRFLGKNADVEVLQRRLRHQRLSPPWHRVDGGGPRGPPRSTSGTGGDARSTQLTSPTRPRLDGDAGATWSSTRCSWRSSSWSASARDLPRLQPRHQHVERRSWSSRRQVRRHRRE